MKLTVHRSCADFTSYRAARVKSLFNVETGADFRLEADLPIDEPGWSVGVIVGPSGSGKSSLGRSIALAQTGSERMWNERTRWPKDAPIVDAIAPDAPGGFDAATSALSAVGLGTVPSWLRPFAVLSNGERFRAELARLVCEAPAFAVVDEFSSVVDRQIARVGAAAFAKAWRRTEGRVVLLTCHYDVLDWIEPDWIFDTSTGELARGRLRRRPSVELEVREARADAWSLFAPHHYLSLPRMVACRHYVGMIEGEPVAHVAFATRWLPGENLEARACRLVVMPEWQGIGVGLRFLNAVCERYLAGRGHHRLPMTTLFHTSHPGLAAALRRAKGWRQVSATLHGEHKGRSCASIARSKARRGGMMVGSGYGGHFRAVQGFRFYGARRLGQC